MVIETVHCFYVVRVSTSEVMIVGGEDWLSIDHVHGSRSVRRCCNKFCDTRIKNTVNMACHVTQYAIWTEVYCDQVSQCMQKHLHEM